MDQYLQKVEADVIYKLCYIFPHTNKLADKKRTGRHNDSTL